MAFDDGERSGRKLKAREFGGFQQNKEDRGRPLLQLHAWCWQVGAIQCAPQVRPSKRGSAAWGALAPLLGARAFFVRLCLDKKR